MNPKSLAHTHKGSTKNGQVNPIYKGYLRCGVIVLAASTAQHLTLIRELSTGTWQPGRISRNAVILAILLTLVGLAMSAYLLILRQALHTSYSADPNVRVSMSFPDLLCHK